MRLKLAVVLVLVASVLAVYGQTRHFEFVNYDDSAYLYENPPAQRGLSADSIHWAFTTIYLANYAPLTWLTFLADYARAGLDPGAYHTTNVLFHAANAALLFFVLTRLTASLWPSALVALLFALHPLHVESVAWVSSRKDVVSTFFALLALTAYARFARSRRIAWYAALCGAFVCSLLAKSMWVTLPCLLLLLDYWPVQRDDRVKWPRLWLEKLPLFAIAAVFSAVAVYAQRAGGAMPDTDILSFPLRLQNAAVSYLRYLTSSVWPAKLIPYYTHPKDSLTVIQVGGAVALLMVFSLIAWRLRKSRPYIPIGWLWYLGTLVPVIGIIQVGGQAMADRYAYVPLIGIYIAFAWALADLARGSVTRRATTVGAAVFFLVALAVTSHAQTARWKNSITLFEYTLSVDPENSVALGNLGGAYIASARYADAAEVTTRALELRPDNPGNLRNLGFALRKQGKLQEAENALRRSIELDPRSARGHNQLALVLMDTNRLDEAEQSLQTAQRIDPNFLDAQVNYGNIWLRRGQLELAAGQYEYVLARHPRNADALSNLGTVRLLETKYPEAIELFHRALEINPHDAVTRTNLAIALRSTGNTEQARRELEAALQDDPTYKNARSLLEDLKKEAAPGQ